ncbi:MAG TPA: hypothetical protein ENH19_01090 [Actinobacteria bacterium]|nr:hypothetical protein [Actinomycetes bacterium]HEX21232.1 hypothetical protein [Actinomycetota bacterium]
MKTKFLALVMVIATLVLLTGCLSTTERTIKDKAGNKVTIDQNNGKLKLKDKTGERSAEFGDNVKLPKDFPKDIPIYKGAKVQTSISTKNDKGTTKIVSFEVEASQKKVSDFYQKALNKSGYRISGTFSSNKLTTFSADRDNAKVVMSIAQNKNKSIVSINVTEK